MPEGKQLLPNGVFQPRKSNDIRTRLVTIALQWQKRFGVAPAITSALSELDAARLVGMTEDEYCAGGVQRTAVTRGHDFEYRGHRYQVKANRPSGKRGSKARIIAKPKNYDWDRLIWILYDRDYVMREAWEWRVRRFRRYFESVDRLRPEHMRQGNSLYRVLD